MNRKSKATSLLPLMTATRFSWLILAVVFSSSRCDPRPTRSSTGSKTESVNGVEITTVTGEPPAWSARKIFDVPGDSFGSISSLAQDAAGNVYVADGLNKVIFVFSPTGSILRRIGSAGSGPGEYRSPASISFVGDTLAVYDAGNVRIGLFSTLGSWLGQWPLRPANGMFVQTGEREFWARTVRWKGKSVEHIYVRHGPRGPEDTMPYRLAAAPTAEPANRIDCEMKDGSIAMFVGAPEFTTWSAVKPVREGLAVDTDPTGYRIKFLRGSDTVGVLQYLTPDTATTDAEWSAEEVKWKRFRSENPGGRCSSTLGRPSKKRLIADILPSVDGSIWVIRTSPDGATRTRVDIFDADNRIIGKLDLPKFKILSQRGDKLAVVTRDSLDIESLHVFELKR